MKVGDRVKWGYSNRVAEGKVESIHDEPTEIICKGKCVKRDGSKDNPALIIMHKSGDDVLKLMSEVQIVSK